MKQNLDDGVLSIRKSAAAACDWLFQSAAPEPITLFRSKVPHILRIAGSRDWNCENRSSIGIYASSYRTREGRGHMPVLVREKALERHMRELRADAVAQALSARDVARTSLLLSADTSSHEQVWYRPICRGIGPTPATQARPLRIERPATPLDGPAGHCDKRRRLCVMLLHCCMMCVYSKVQVCIA